MVDRARGLSFRVIVREGPLKYCSWSTGEQDFRRLMRGAIKNITNVTFYNHSADPRNTRWFLNALRCIPHSVAIYELSDEQRYDLRGIKSVLGANSIKLRNATFIIWDSDMLACKELAFVGKVWHNATSLYAIFQQCPSLTKLTFDLPIPWNTGLVFHSPLPRLKELTIGSTKALVELNQVVPHFRFPTLVELKVGLCTPASLTNFLELHPTLRQVTLELSTNLISVEFLRRLSSDTPLFPTEEAFLDIESLHIDAWSIAVGLVAFNRLLRNGAFFGRQYGYSKPLTLTIKTNVMSTQALLLRLPTDLLLRILRCTLPEGNARDKAEDSLVCEIPEAWTTLEIFLHLPPDILSHYVTTMTDRARGYFFRVIVREGPSKYCQWATSEQDFRQLMEAPIKKIRNIIFYNHSANTRNTRWLLDALPCIPRSVAIHELSDERHYDLRGIKSILEARSIELHNATFKIGNSDTLSCKELTFAGKVWSATSIFAIFQRSKSLKKLTFDLAIPWKAGLVFRSALPPLTELSIQTGPDFSFPHLVKLTVGLCTPAGLTWFLERHPRIQELTMEVSTNLISFNFLRQVATNPPLFSTEDTFTGIEYLHIHAQTIEIGLAEFNRLMRNDVLFGRHYGYSKPLTLTIKTKTDLETASGYVAVANVELGGAMCQISWS
ncbi:SubName: Full=Uncharacterized protein {ECO:0000313/EMBL:CCA70303.1} [Serendipita indica DSM 11827]|nr:SubName: Full=Uncharacterized protein {ECO:0000313/EMBL:CCA70303.1} [Serendipita indica DSM 11827]